MITSLNLRRISCPAIKLDYGQQFTGNAVTLHPSNFRRRQPHNWRLASLSTNSTTSSSFEPSVASSTTFISSVGSPPSSLPSLSQWNLTQRHILVLNFIACAVSLYLSSIFFCNVILQIICYRLKLLWISFSMNFKLRACDCGYLCLKNAGL